MLKFQNGPGAGKANGLCIRRAPLYLRLVENRKGDWDALDQLNDFADPQETIYAYRKVEDHGTIHICRRPHGSGTFCMATYAFVDPQPPDETMRDNLAWRAWAMEQAKARIAEREVRQS